MKNCPNQTLSRKLMLCMFQRIMFYSKNLENDPILLNNDSSLTLIQERAKSHVRSKHDRRHVSSKAKQKLTSELNKFEAYRCK